MDAHAHYPGSVEVSLDPFSPIKTIEDEISFLSSRGVERAVLLAPLGDWLKGNRMTKEAVEKYPGWFVPFCTVNPTFGEVAVRELHKCVKEWGFRGLKLHPQVHCYPADSLIAQRVMEEAAKLRVPVFFHTGDWMVGQPYSLLARYVKVAETFPDVTIIMGHMGVSDWPEALAMAKRYDNLILDTTGSTITYGVMEASVEAVGSKRIVWGSDVPLYDPIMALSKVRDSDISEEAKRLILGENIVRILGLKLKGWKSDDR